MFKKIVSLTLCLLLALWMPVGAWATGTLDGDPTTPTTVKVTFNANGGVFKAGVQTEQSAKQDNSTWKYPELIVNPPDTDANISRDGYTLSGWSTEKDNENTKVTADGTIPAEIIQESITLFAIWTANTYTVTYDANGGTVTPTTQQVTFGGTYGTLPTPTLAGKVFDGWFTDPNNGTQVTSTKTVATANDHTLYAHWSDATTTTEYTISFNANGGSGTMSSIQTTGGRLLTSPSCGFTPPTGKVFGGWSIAPAGAILDFSSGQPFNSNTTLYAIWKDATKIKVVYHGNGGYWTDGAGKPTMLEYECALGDKYPHNTFPSRPGYTCTGWFTDASGGTSITITDTSTIPTNITGTYNIYAQWEPADVNVVFEPAGGTLKNAGYSKMVKPGEKFGDLPEVNPPTGKNYTFEGWYDKKAGGSKVTKDTTVSAPELLNGSITLYARWSGIKVRFELGGDYASMPNTDKEREVTYGSTYGAAKRLPTPSRVGYTFLGWYLDDKFETKVEDNTPVEKAEDHTLYAKWTTGGFKVKLDPNGGKVTPTEMTFDYSGQYVGLPTPTLDGYEFDGWYTQPTGGKKVTATDKVNAEHKTLYAHWTAAGNVKLDANGGKFPEGTRTTIHAEAGGSYPALPVNLTREGYDFKGWTTTKDDINTLIQVGGQVSSPAPTTLYALWSGKTYKVTYDFNGGTSDPITRNVIFGQKYTSLPSAHRGGYTFIGWFTAATGGTAVTTDTTVSTASDHTLYAHWGFNVEFNANGGTGSMDPMKVTAGESVTLPACGFTPPYDKVFSHWAIGSAMGEEITGSSYAFHANTTLYAIWKDAPLTITAKASVGGAISPSGSVSVDRGKDQTFRITARDGYRITDVLVDGKSYGPIESHVFRNVEEDHTIEAIFTAVSAPGYISCDKGLECPLADFSDLDPNAWYHDAIHYCMDNVLMTGTSKTKYNQSQRTDRATLAEIIWRSEGCPNPVGTGSLNQPYKDVPPTKWFYKSVTWASRNKIVSGYGNGKFGPSDLITREQVATILWRHAGSPELTDVRMPYYDAYEISDFAWEAMCWATQRGILKGKGDGILDPKGYATRAEIAQMMMNYLK